MSFVDRIKSLFSGRSDEGDQANQQPLSPTHSEPAARQPTEAEIEAAAAAAPLVAPVEPPAASGEPSADADGVRRYDGVDGRAGGEALDERDDSAP
jgi:hypothetical protein